MSCNRNGYPWPALATSPYSSSPLYVFMFELVVLLLLGHMWGFIWVHHLWARPCFSSSVLDVWKQNRRDEELACATRKLVSILLSIMSLSPTKLKCRKFYKILCCFILCKTLDSVLFLFGLGRSLFIALKSISAKFIDSLSCVNKISPIFR